MTSPADVSSDLSVPFSLLAGTVRNATEAATLAHLDLLAIQAEAIDEHIAATARYTSALTSAVEDARAAASKRERPGAEDGSVGLGSTTPQVFAVHKEVSGRNYWDHWDHRSIGSGPTLGPLAARVCITLFLASNSSMSKPSTN